MSDLAQSLASLFQKAYEQGVEDGRKQPLIKHEMITRKQMKEKFGIAPDSFDDYYRSVQGFPSYQEGRSQKYYEPAVHEWLMDHQQFNN